MLPRPPSRSVEHMDRLSAQDASFLHLEDRVTHLHIGAIAVFEGPAPPIREFERMVEGHLPAVPRYRQRLRFVPYALGRPVWVDDPHFQIGFHIRHTALPRPGGDEELRRLVGRVMSQQLDRSRAALGDVGGRAARGGPLGADHEASPRDGGRGLGRRAAGGDPRPRAPPGAAARRGVAARAPAARCRAGRARARCPRADAAARDARAS